MVTLRFVRGNSLTSRAINFFEGDGGWPTHVETVMPDGTWLGALMEGGVLARATNYDAGSVVRQEFVSVEFGLTVDAIGSSRQSAIKAKEETFYAFLRAQVGKPYDFTAIEAFIAHRNWQEDDSWFCSELVSAALVACGYFPDLVVPSNKIMPSALLFGLGCRFPIDAARGNWKAT